MPSQCYQGQRCVTPEILARNKAKAQAMHDEFVRQHIAKQRRQNVFNDVKKFGMGNSTFWVGLIAVAVVFLAFKK